MNYFTRDLIAQGQSQDDHVLAKAEEAWDLACDRYFAYLDSVKDELPPGLRRRVDAYYLHDAVIQVMSQQGKSFVIVLQLDTPPQSLLTLTYELIADPIIAKEATVVRSAGIVEWQYDEIKRLDGNSWEQSILLGNGWEVTLRFRDMAIHEAQAILPAPRGQQPPVVQSA